MFCTNNNFAQRHLLGQEGALSLTILMMRIADTVPAALCWSLHRLHLTYHYPAPSSETLKSVQQPQCQHRENLLWVWRSGSHQGTHEIQ